MCVYLNMRVCLSVSFAVRLEIECDCVFLDVRVCLCCRLVVMRVRTARCGKTMSSCLCLAILRRYGFIVLVCMSVCVCVWCV